jgi:hypothetical protein
MSCVASWLTGSGMAEQKTPSGSSRRPSVAPLAGYDRTQAANPRKSASGIRQHRRAVETAFLQLHATIYKRSAMFVMNAE